jgi:hypothetical protein
MMPSLPEEATEQRWLTLAIGYSAFVTGRSLLRHGSAVIGAGSSPLPRAVEPVLFLAALAGFVGTFAVLGSKRWGLWLTLGAAAVLALLYLLLGMPWYLAPVFLLAPSFLAIAVRPQWRYMD